MITTVMMIEKHFLGLLFLYVIDYGIRVFCYAYYGLYGVFIIHQLFGMVTMGWNSY